MAEKPPGVNPGKSGELPPDFPLHTDFPTTISNVVSREEWGAEPPSGVARYPSLPTFIRFVHTAYFEPCTDRESCINDLRKLQKEHMAEGFPDIKFNFLIGDGGTIYEGRGWKTDIELPNEFRLVQGKCLDIAYMGHFKYALPPWDMMVSAFNLLLHGVNDKLLSPFFDFQHLMID